MNWIQQRGGLRTKSAEGNVSDKIDERGKLYGRVEKLEEFQAQLNALNDKLIVDNANLSARVLVLEAQNTAQAAELTKYEETRLERDRLKVELDRTKQRVTDLEREMAQLQARTLPTT